MVSQNTRDSVAAGIRELAGGEREWLRAVWDTSPDAMALSAPDGTVLAVNPAYCSLYGYAPEELLHRPFWIIFPQAARAWAAEQYREVFEADSPPAAFEAVVQRRSGEARTVESRVSFLAREGQRIAMLSLIRDVTEQRQAATAAHQLAEENAALYAQATATLQLREEFIAMASHELKNPLAALRGFAEHLQRRGTYQGNLVEAIIQQTARIDRLIRNMLDYSLAQSGHLQLRLTPVDLVSLVQAAVTQAQILTRQHTVRLEAPSHPLVGNWDPDRLDQVLQNLLTNAVKYAPDGGEVLVRVVEAGSLVRVSVTDHGTGIAEEAIPHLFDRFYRSPEAAASHAGGLGLGLSITQMLVEAHGGQIMVQSRLGEGSTFAIDLPYQADISAEVR